MEKEQYMLPPWIMYPNIPQGSIGWRMGAGEDYICKYYDWRNNLTTQEINKYDNLFPRPICWDLDTDNLLQKDSFFVDNWKKTAKKSLSNSEICKNITKEFTEYSKDRKGKCKQIYSPSELHLKDNNKFIFFWGHSSNEGVIDKSCLSQWYLSDFYVGSSKYSCMEQYMMSQKAELFGDDEICNQIMEATSQKEIKALGRKVHNFDEQVWNKFKFDIVLTGNYYKFSQNEKLRNYLISTSPAILVEASPYDRIWGIKMSQSDENITNPDCWKGKNLLGYALTYVREEIIRVWKNTL